MAFTPKVAAKDIEQKASVELEGVVQDSGHDASADEDIAGSLTPSHERDPEAVKVHEALLTSFPNQFRITNAYKSLGNETDGLAAGDMLKAVLEESMKPKAEGEKTPEIKRSINASILVEKAITESRDDMPLGVHPVGAGLAAIALKNATQFDSTRPIAKDADSARAALAKYADPANKFGIESWIGVDAEKAKAVERKAVQLLSDAVTHAETAGGSRNQATIRLVEEVLKGQGAVTSVKKALAADGVPADFKRQTLSGALTSLEVSASSTATTPAKVLEALKTQAWTTSNLDSTATHAKEIAHLIVKEDPGNAHKEFVEHVIGRRAEAVEARKMGPDALKGFVEWLKDNKGDIPATADAAGSSLRVPVAYDNPMLSVSEEDPRFDATRIKTAVFRGKNLEGLHENLCVLAGIAEGNQGKATNYFAADATRGNAAFELMGLKAVAWDRETVDA